MNRINSFARAKVPRAILTHLLNGEYYQIVDLCNLANGKPFCTRTVRYWTRHLIIHGYLKGVTNHQKDARVKMYRIPPGMLETARELLRRLPEDECQRLQ